MTSLSKVIIMLPGFWSGPTRHARLVKMRADFLTRKPPILQTIERNRISYYVDETNKEMTDLSGNELLAEIIKGVEIDVNTVTVGRKRNPVSRMFPIRPCIVAICNEEQKAMILMSAATDEKVFLP